MKTYRLNLTLSEVERLQDILRDIQKIDDFEQYYNQLESFKTLKEKIQKPTEIKYSGAKYQASQTATEARTAKAKKKIDNAINILRMENKKITHYSIANIGNVAYNTVKKYLTNDSIISLNENK